MNIEVANRLQKLRKEKGYSQEHLAEALGISRQAVSKWERAEASPDTDNLILLARLYGVSLDELLSTDDDNDELKANNQANEEEKNTFLQWVEEHKDVELHVTREGAADSLICFKEDERYVTDPETGEQVRAPAWLFDSYTDILIKDTDGVYKTVYEIEELRAEAEEAEEKNKETAK